MEVPELKTRFQRFRHDYLETAVGREHLATEVSEPTEVQLIFEELSKKRLAKQDITDEALRKLLPHLDTKGNRERGTRISTWPCVTKDVRAWFEGAKWKTPSDWPAVAEWLLDVCDAGAKEDWSRWHNWRKSRFKKALHVGLSRRLYTA